MTPSSSHAVFPGPIRQAGHVVPELQPAIDQWLAQGVGPWFLLKMPLTMNCRGAEITPDLTIAFANSGELQVELIAQHDDSPTLYREFLDAGHEGLHHHAWWVEDIDAVISGAVAAGWREVCSGDGGGAARFTYLEHDDLPGVTAELMALTPAIEPFMDHIREAAVDWDGTEPVRGSA
jgi:hypothetical protein